MSDKAMVHSGASASIPVEGGAGRFAELIARLEAAEVGSWALDSDIFEALNLRTPRQDGLKSTTLPNVSESLDAALALAERLGLDVFAIMYAAIMNWKAHDPRGPMSEALPLALCIAILKALEAKQ